jgi:integrase
MGMKKVSRAKHLLPRNGIWYYHLRVPDDLRPILKKKVVKFSLRTESKKTATKLAELHDVEWSARFDEASRRHASGKSSMPRLPVAAILAEQAVRDYVARMDKRSSERLTLNPPSSSSELNDMVANIEYSLQILKNLDDPRADEFVLKAARKIVNDASLGFDNSSIPDPVLADKILRALIELDRRKLARLKHDNDRQFFDGLFDPKSRQTENFGDLCRHYLTIADEDAAINHRSPKTSDTRQAKVRMVQDIMGADTPVCDIDFDACLKFRSILAKVPTNWRKRYQGITLAAAIQKSEQSNHNTLSAVSQMQYFATFKEILNLAVNRALLPNNPAFKMLPIKKDNESQKDKRDPFSYEQLRIIFSSGVYVDADHKDNPFMEDKNGGWRFWLPLICLLSGMRPKEVCQLRLGDIVQAAGGTWYFDINDDKDEFGEKFKNIPPKTLKTKASRRKIPIHPHLIRMGILEYVQFRHNSDEVLLFTITPDKHGNQATYALRWLREYHFQTVLGRTPRQPVYSLRHNFRDALRRAEATPEILLALGAWEQGSRITSDNYGAGLGPDELAVHVAKIDYPDLNLTPLWMK